VLRLSRTAIGVAFVLAVAACTDANKAPAEAAVSAAEAAIGTLDAEAMKYAPGAVASVQKNIASAKDLISKQDFKSALGKAQGIPAEVKQIGLAVADAKHAELVKAWDRIAADVRGMTAAIKNQLATLGQVKKLPAGVSKDALAAAKDAVKSVEAGTHKLSEDFKAGKATEAIAGGKELVARCGQIMRSIAMTPPESTALIQK